jgi:hypothetical protein
MEKAKAGRPPENRLHDETDLDHGAPTYAEMGLNKTQAQPVARRGEPATRETVQRAENTRADTAERLAADLGVSAPTIKRDGADWRTGHLGRAE